MKAVEELKSHVTEDVNLSLAEKSRDVCAKWEVRLCIIYVCGPYRSDPGAVCHQSFLVVPLSTLYHRGLVSAGYSSQVLQYLASVCVQPITTLEIRRLERVKRGSPKAFFSSLFDRVSGSCVFPWLQVHNSSLWWVTLLPGLYWSFQPSDANLPGDANLWIA